MSERDRLATDLRHIIDSLPPTLPLAYDVPAIADRLIARGWTQSADEGERAAREFVESITLRGLDEERLARALGIAGDPEGLHYWCKDIDGCGLYSDGREFAAALAKAYREDTDA